MSREENEAFQVQDVVVAWWKGVKPFLKDLGDAYRIPCKVALQGHSALKICSPVSISL